MCRFTANLAPPSAPAQAETGLQSLLNDEDDFNWFDAIDAELNDVDLGPVVTACAAEAAEQGSSDMASDGADSKTSAGSSGTSSYDLVEMFKQQVQQQQQVPAVQPQFVAAPFPAVAQGQLMCGMSGPYAAACVAPQLLAAPLAAPAGAAAFLPQALPAAAAPMMGVLDQAAAAAGAPAVPAAAAAVAPCGSGSAPGSMCGSSRVRRSQKTQEEIDAAVERIKQKRRESAQRSRARKNDYMRQLELENQALRDEVQRLQQVLAAVQRTAFQPAALLQLGAM